VDLEMFVKLILVEKPEEMFSDTWFLEYYIEYTRGIYLNMKLLKQCLGYFIILSVTHGLWHWLMHRIASNEQINYKLNRIVDKVSDLTHGVII